MCADPFDPYDALFEIDGNDQSIIIPLNVEHDRSAETMLAVAWLRLIRAIIASLIAPASIAATIILACSIAVCSAEWIIDGYTFDLAPIAHILGEQLAAAERASGSYDRGVPIRQPMYHLDLQRVDHDR